MIKGPGAIISGSGAPGGIVNVLTKRPTGRDRAFGLRRTLGDYARLSRLVGRSRALEVVLGCDDIPAETAEAWGWIKRALPAEALWPHVDRLAARIASFPPHAVAAAKASVLQAEATVAIVVSTVAFMASDAFAANPIGVEYDPDALLAQYRAGADNETLLKRGPGPMSAIPAAHGLS